MRFAVALFLGALAATPAMAETLHVGTPAGGNFTFVPVRIGTEQGIFAKHGLDVEVTDFGGGAKLQQAMAAGSVDMAVSAGTDVSFIAKGAAALAVAAIGNRPPLGITVPYDSPAKTVDDLKGKRVGVTTKGSLTEWMMIQLMKKKGWAKDDVTLIAIGSEISGNVALLTTGQIDAVVAPPALGVQLELTKRGRLLLPSFELDRDFLGEAIYASNAIMRDHPDVVRGFIEGWFETIAWMRAHKPETIEAARKYTGRTPEVESREYDLVMPVFSADGHFHPAALQTLQETFVEMGTFEQPPDMTKLYTEAYLPKN